jgi:AmmeMemoRadiSam system protein A
LRGCIGGLEPVRPLVQDVADNAYAAAFQDPRFPPLEAAEFNAVKIHISLLTLPQALVFSSEQNALTQLRPGIDGVILQEGERRATFLPSVWKSLISPERFLSSLKEKAGFSADYWSETLRLFRYGCEEIDENDL